MINYNVLIGSDELFHSGISLSGLLSVYQILFYCSLVTRVFKLQALFKYCFKNAYIFVNSEAAFVKAALFPKASLLANASSHLNAKTGFSNVATSTTFVS